MMTQDEQIRALQEEVKALKEQVFVLTDKANQALLNAESQAALLFAATSQSKDKQDLLAKYLHMCKQVDESPMDKARTEFEQQVKKMIRQNTIAHLQAKV